jgi:hypothetical protein
VRWWVAPVSGYQFYFGGRLGKNNRLERADMEQTVVQQELDRGVDSTWGQCAQFSHKAGRWDVKTVPNQMGNMYLCHGQDRLIPNLGSCWCCSPDRNSPDLGMVHLGMKN